MSRKCSGCKKELLEDEWAWYIEESGDYYCHDSLDSIENIFNSCVYKEMIKCGYEKEYIIKMITDYDFEDLNFFGTTVLD